MVDESNKNLLRHWEVFKGVDGKQLSDIKFFHAFRTYTGDGNERLPSAIFVTSKDEVFAIGHNNKDNLLALTGNNFAKHVELKEPKKIDELSGKHIVKIVVSERFGAALTEEGKLLYWGTAMEALQFEADDKKYVRLPHEPRENFIIRDMVCGAHSMIFVTNENQVRIWGCINLYYSEFYNFENVPLRKFVKVTGMASGWYHAALLDKKGQVWTFGYGSVGQLGYKSVNRDYLTPRKVSLKSSCKKIECGAYSTLFLLTNGELYACGSNSESDYLCVGKKGYVITPTKVLLEHKISDIAATYAWSSGKWQSLFSAVSHDGGSYFKWGNDAKSDNPKTLDGALNFFDVFANFKTPQSLGNLTGAELVGSNIDGLSPDTLPNRSFLDRWSVFDSLDSDFKRNISHFTVFQGFMDSRHIFEAFMKTNTDDVYILQREISLVLPSERVNNASPLKVEIFSGKNIKKIIVNEGRGYALSNGGSLYEWETNSESVPENRLKGKTVTDFGCGSKFVVYLLKNSEVYLNGIMSSDFPDEIHKKIDIPGKENAIGLAAGAWHFLVLTDASNVYAFGDGKYAQLGTSSWKKNDKLPLQGTRINSSPCKKIMCGTTSSFFLTDEGELYGCGLNNYADPLGLGHSNATVTKPERVKIYEKVKDIAASNMVNPFGGRYSIFGLKTASGKIYKWDGETEGLKPVELAGAKFLVEAFEDHIIPDSLSLVRLSSAISDDNDENTGDLYFQGSLELTGTIPKNLFGDPLYSDVTIKLKDGVIPGHKVLLHTKSDFFRKAMSSNEVFNRDELDLVSYNPKAIRALLKHIYDLPIGQQATLMSDVEDFLNLAVDDGNPDLIEKAKELMLMNKVFATYSQNNVLPNSTLISSEDGSSKTIQEFIDSSIFP